MKEVRCVHAHEKPVEDREEREQPAEVCLCMCERCRLIMVRILCATTVSAPIPKCGVVEATSVSFIWMRCGPEKDTNSIVSCEVSYCDFL